MKNRKRNKKNPPELIAARRANREIERILLGDGFHAKTRVKKSKRVYSRKQKHSPSEEE